MLKNILLYSRESPSNTVRVVQGHSGKIYGHARFNPAQNRMECRFTPKEFTQQMAEDIVANMHRSYCKWVFWPEITPTTEDAMDPAAESESETAAAEVASEEDPKSAPLDAIPESTRDDALTGDLYAGKGFRQLRAMAKERGVQNIELFTKSAELIDAMKALEG